MTRPHPDQLPRRPQPTALAGCLALTMLALALAVGAYYFAPWAPGFSAG